MTYSGFDYTSGVYRPDPLVLGGYGGSGVTVRAARHQREYQRKLQTYEKEFNINLTRIACKEKELKDSMLAYSEHARQVNRKRYGLPSDGGHGRPPVLQVTARHISRSEQLPKLLDSSKQHKTKKRVRIKQCPETKVSTGTENEPEEEPEATSVSKATQVPIREKENLKVSLASAADLGDILANNRPTDPVLSWNTSGAAVLRPRKSVRLKHNQTAATGQMTSSHCPVDKESTTGTVDNRSINSEIEARKRAEEHTRKLLRDAIQSLKLLEHSKTDPLALLPRLKKSRKLQLHSSSLDAIPEAEQEQELNSSKSASASHSHSPRRLPRLHTPSQHLLSTSRSSLDNIPEAVHEEEKTVTALPPGERAHNERHVHWSESDRKSLRAAGHRSDQIRRLRARARKKMYGARKIRYLRP